MSHLYCAVFCRMQRSNVRVAFDFDIRRPQIAPPMIDYLCLDMVDGKKFKPIKVGGRMVSRKVRFYTDFGQEETFDLSSNGGHNRGRVTYNGEEMEIGDDPDEAGEGAGDNGERNSDGSEEDDDMCVD